MQLVEEVAFRRLDARLAQLLVQRGPVVAATQQKLAEELGSVREIVSRLLRQFEAAAGWNSAASASRCATRARSPSSRGALLRFR